MEIFRLVRLRTEETKRQGLVRISRPFGHAGALMSATGPAYLGISLDKLVISGHQSSSV